MLPRTPFAQGCWVAGAYAVLGAAWIGFSDGILAAAIHDIATLTQVQTIKGWAFVALSSAVILVLVKRAVIRQAAQDQAALREKEVLLGEIHHRVRNNLQLVISLLALESSKFSDAAVHAAFDDALARIHALGLVHQQLYQRDDLSSIDCHSYVRELCDALSQAMAPPQVGVTLHLQPANCNMAHAIPMGLILAELVMNAFKHAFPAGRSGTVWVRLEPAEDGLCLMVEDDGIGFGDTMLASPGTGMTIVRMLTAQLGGTLVATPRPGGGTCIKLEVPL